MARRASPADVLRRTRQEANRYADRVGKERLQKLLEKAQSDLARRLTEVERLRGAGADTFTAVQMRLTLAQVQQVLKEMSPEFQRLIQNQGKEAAERSAAALLSYMQSAEQRYKGIATRLPIREAGLIDRAVQRTETSVLRRIASHPEDPAAKGILARYGMNVIRSFEDELQLGLATRKPWGEVRGELLGKSSFLQQAPAHWAERIVRTETMAAAGRGAWETTREADAVLGDMVKILCATFDNRTSWDSYQVHGQIRLPNEAFDWKGGSYQHPPNRPNDREVVVPHRISWPIPDYLAPKSDGEVAARFAEEGRKGSPGPRPNMSTVDRSLFGKEQPLPGREQAQEPSEPEKVAVPRALPKPLEKEPRAAPEVAIGKRGHIRESVAQTPAHKQVVSELTDDLRRSPDMVGLLAKVPLQSVKVRDAIKLKEGIAGGLYDPQMRAITVAASRADAAPAPLGKSRTQSVSTSASDAREARRAAFLHELGHHMKEGLSSSVFAGSVDIPMAKSSDIRSRLDSEVDAAWKGVMERKRAYTEGSRLPTISEYAMTNRGEYFAECWSAYFTRGSELKKVDPAGWKMIDNAKKLLAAELPDAVKR